MLEESWGLPNMFNPVAFCMRLPMSGVCNSVGLASIFGVLFINICFSFYFFFIRHYFILYTVMSGSLLANYTVWVLFVVQGRSSMSFGLWWIVVSLGLFPYSFKEGFSFLYTFVPHTIKNVFFLWNLFQFETARRQTTIADI